MAKLLPRQYAKVLYTLTKDVSPDKVDSLIHEFVAYLKREQVISKAPFIIEEFVQYSKEQDGVEFLDISSAKKLTEAQVKDIADHFGKKTEVTTKIDEELIGGVVIKKGNVILDGSVKTQLMKLKGKMVNGISKC
jgi:F-type H+-transporting ATPase subunit delta